MRFAVLSGAKNAPTTRRLVEAARARGHQARVLDPLRLELSLEGARASLLLRRKRLRMPDALIPRIPPSMASFGLLAVDQFALRGAVVMNSAQAIGQARNPARCLQRLAAHGISIPSTLMARDAGSLRAMVKRVGGLPVLVKLVDDHRRRVIVCETEPSLEAVLEALLGLGHNIVIQEYVRGQVRDLRVVVVGGRALAAVERTPKRGRMSRTLHGLSRLTAVSLTEPVRRTAERVASLCELEVCAVDMLDHERSGPTVFEVNASPALLALESVTGVDLATPIIARGESLVASARAPHGMATHGAIRSGA